MTSTSLAFQQAGNSGALLASDSSADQQLTFEPSGQTPGAFYVYNSSDQVAFVNFDYTGTANVVIPSIQNTDGRGFPVFRYAPVLVNLNQGFNYDSGNLYITAVTEAGTATVYFTPIA